ncbi:translation initiation factor eIF-2B subunit delta [Bactrocera neohumeralis]|uniref:translation initiation factor eIF-2B subunit delta n=1 Tax=Bactrocera neohumeralis TaxID=98809 RepID=UPI0021658A6F|nr:translation initiation factor eIF-2B subunit delta [Bactrocera neohumeralis]
MSGTQDHKVLLANQDKKSDGTTAKKKRPRQRLRKRNKRYINSSESKAEYLGADEEKAIGITNNILGLQLSVHQIPNKSPIEVSQSSSESVSVDTSEKIGTKEVSQHILSKSHEFQSDEIKEISPDTSNILYQPQITTQTLTNIQNSNSQSKHNSKLGKEAIIKIAMSANSAPATNSSAGKTREEIMAEREAKKLAKQMKKAKNLGVNSEAAPTTPVVGRSVSNVVSQEQDTITNPPSNVIDTHTSAAVEKSREQIKAEREAKKKAKQALKEAKTSGVTEIIAKLDDTKITENLSTNSMQEEKKKSALSKSERRAIQEAQRAAKAQVLAQKNVTPKVKPTAASAKQATKLPTDPPVKATINTSNSSPTKSISPVTKSNRINDCKVRLFNHLEKARQEANLFLNNPHIHPSIARLGEQYAQRTIVGSNARCIGFLNALKMVIRDFETPPKKEFARSLETTITNSVEHLQKCRPLAVSVSNAYKHIKHVLTQLPTDQPETDLKENLCRFIDTYIENQIGKAAEAISYSVQEKISNGDVILTFGCSSLITYIFEEALRRRVDFRVIVVDSRPFCEGQELLRRLTVKGIPCSYVLINAVSFVMPESTKVLLGAHALLANGYVMARTGTAQVALVAHSFNVPVLVCCETHKFSERSQTDAIVYNELGNPDDLIRSAQCSLANWQTKGKMSPLNLMYDITPPELVTAVVTEVSILPCTSVPVILRIKPTEIGY